MKRVTVGGAGKYGSMTALRIAEYDIVDSVVMTDIVDGLPQGLALDMNQSKYVEKFSTNISGTNKYEDTSDSDVVVITAGLPRKPGMSRMDLLEVNAKIVTDVTNNIMKYSESPTIVVVTNPLDQMTTLVSEISGLPKNKVIGQAGVLDTSRFAFFISEKLNVNMNDVEALTLGSHGETMVPVPSQCRVNGKLLTEILSKDEIDDLQKVLLKYSPNSKKLSYFEIFLNQMSIFQQDLKIHAEIEENVLMKKTTTILNSLEIKNV